MSDTETENAEQAITDILGFVIEDVAEMQIRVASLNNRLNRDASDVDDWEDVDQLMDEIDGLLGVTTDGVDVLRERLEEVR